MLKLRKTNQTLRTSAHLFSKVAFLLVLLAAAACITVNVNFPESAVQRAADDFVRDLYGKQASGVKVADTSSAAATATEADALKAAVKKAPKKKAAKAPASAPAAANPEISPAPAKPAQGASLLDLLIPSAFAQELMMDSPKAKQLKARLASRVVEIVKWKTKGVLGEGQDGLLVLKEPAAAGGEASKVSKLVKAENDDRDALYEEIQTANSITDRKQTRIRKFFGAAFRSNSPAGTWVESESGEWAKK